MSLYEMDRSIRQDTPRSPRAAARSMGDFQGSLKKQDTVENRISHLEQELKKMKRNLAA